MTFCLGSSAWNIIKNEWIKEIKNMDKKQKILIVDDAKFNRDILKEILGDTYNYLEAENGNQAIQMIGENIGIDLMLLDINMPQMNGFEVLEIMKRSQCIAETPVIMISSEDAVNTTVSYTHLDVYKRQGYNIEEISRNNSLAGKTKTSEFKELIIRNYEK